MILSIDPEHPEGRKVHRVAELLAGGGLVVLPTDTVYALACDVLNRRAIERMRGVRDLPRNKLFSLLCADLSDVGTYAGYMSGFAYRTLRRILPGPYTFVVEASDQLPRILHSRRRTVGLRVPDCAIARDVVRQLGRPLACTSLRTDDDGPLGDPEELERRFGRQVDLVVDGGIVVSEPSTVIDLTGEAPEVIRVGKGDVSLFT